MIYKVIFSVKTKGTYLTTRLDRTIIRFEKILNSTIALLSFCYLNCSIKQAASKACEKRKQSWLVHSTGASYTVLLYFYSSMSVECKPWITDSLRSFTNDSSQMDTGISIYWGGGWWLCRFNSIMMMGVSHRGVAGPLPNLNRTKNRKFGLSVFENRLILWVFGLGFGSVLVS